jgi:glycerophosphoryl diester phosphodiesterase
LWNIAHRGASGYAPENTRAAFDLALAMEATAIETDLRMTVDGAVVLFHDATVDRVTNGHGPVDDHTLAELRSLTVGAGAAVGPQHQILTLDELLDEYAARTQLVLELKDARVTVPMLDRLRERGLTDAVTITSFLWHPLLTVREQEPDLAVGFLTPTFEDDIVARAHRRGFQQICPHVSQLTARRVQRAKTHGLRVRAFGIEHRFQIERLFETGADGATVNWPDWITDYQRRADTAEP